MHTSENIEKLKQFTTKWEGGLSRHADDPASNFPNPLEYNGQKGWHTNQGITYAVWHKYFPDDDKGFFVMEPEKWFKIFKHGYWDNMRCDEINDFAVAVYCFGMAWGSGKYIATLLTQYAVNCGGKKIAIDGALGPNTLKGINDCDPKFLFGELLNIRKTFFYFITGTKIENNHWSFMEELSMKKTRSGRRLISQDISKQKFLKGWLRRLSDYSRTFNN